MISPARWLSFVNRGQAEIPPFAVMSPATTAARSSTRLGAIETADEDALLRLSTVDAAHAEIQDAGLLFVNGPQAVPSGARGSCRQGEVLQVLIRQDVSNGVDHRALVRPDSLLGVAANSLGLVAGGTAFRLLGFDGCPQIDYRDLRQPQQRFRVGWVTPAYWAPTRYFKTEELRRQYVYPYAGRGLILESNRASLAGGSTRPLLSSLVDFAYRAYDPAIAPDAAPNFKQTSWDLPQLPPTRAGDTQTPIAAAEKGALQIRCNHAGVYQLGFTASIKAVEAGLDLRGMTLGWLIERNRFDYVSHRDDQLVDNESGIFRPDWQEGIYVRPENWAQFEEIDSYFTTVSGATIVTAQQGDRFHVVNAATGVLEIRYLNCWASSLA